MSLFSTLSVAQSGLMSASTQLQITANNVSNAGTEGFTRKSAVITSADLGNTGGGSKVSGFTRASDTILFTTLSKATSNAGLRSAQDNYLQQLQDTLGTSDSDNPPLSQAVADFVNAWTSYASEPESTVTQTQLVQDGTNLVDTIQTVANGVEALDRQCSKEIQSSLTDLNNYLLQIKDLNLKIATATTAGQSAGNQEDERDQIVLKVSELLGVTVMQRDNGQIALYSNTGYQLVDGSYARSFSYNGTDITSDNNLSLSLNTTLLGGKLQALVDFRDTSSSATSSSDPAVGVIQKARDQLNLIASAFTSTVTTATSGAATFASAYNAASSTGTGELSSDFFSGVTTLDTARFDISVNAALLNNTATIKKASGSAVVAALVDSTRVFSTSGLSITGSDYASLVTSSITTFQQAANNVATLKDTADSQEAYLNEKLTNETGVNTDTEMVNLVTLQNIYAANARVMSVVKDLFSVLQSLIT